MPTEAGVLAVATTAFAWSEAQQKRLCCRAARKSLEVGIPECVAAPCNLLPWRVQGQCATSGVQGCTDVRSCIVLDI